MNYLSRSTVSSIVKSFLPGRSHAVGDEGASLIAGYCHLYEQDTKQLRPIPKDRPSIAILYADLARHGRSGAGDLIPRQRLLDGREIFKACIASAGGKLAHFTGDAILAEFADADSALRCAVNVQLAIRKWNASLDSAWQVRYRIGIDLCEALPEGGDDCERAVDLSACLENLAHTCGICVSRTVLEQLPDYSRIRFVSLGRRRLRNIDHPVEVFWIKVDGANLRKPTLPVPDMLYAAH